MQGRAMPVFAWCFVGIVTVLVLGGCGTVPISDDFRLGYERARGALEAGDYATALRHYEHLLPEVDNGPIGAAVRLDYAHTLLRAGQHDQALRVAREIEALDSSPAVSGHAALVAAIAEHAAAERLMVLGAPYEETKSRARAAFRSLELVLRHRPQFDPEGVLMVRMRRLRETLAQLGDRAG